MKRKTFKFVLVPGVFLVIAAIFSIMFLLPRFIERSILPALGDQLSTSLAGEIFTIGFKEAAFGNLVLGDPQNAAISIAAINATYSLPAIWNKNIDTLKINGMSVNLEYEEGKFLIPGIDFGQTREEKTGSPVLREQASINLPFGVDTLQVDNGFFNILYKKQHILVPFSLQLSREKQNNSQRFPSYSLVLQLLPQGEKVAVTGKIDLAGNKGFFDLAADSFRINQFTFLLAGLQENFDFSKTSIAGSLSINLTPFKLTTATIECSFDFINAKTLPVTFGLPAGESGPTKAFHLTARGDNQQWDVAVSGTMQRPIPAIMFLDGSFYVAETAGGAGNIHFKGADTEVTFNTDNYPVKIKGKPELNMDFTVDYAATGKWQTKIENPAGKNSFSISHGPNSLETKIPAFTFESRGSAAGVQADLKFEVAGGNTVVAGASEVHLPMVKLHAMMQKKMESAGADQAGGSFILQFPGAMLQNKTISANADIVLSGDINLQELHDMEALQTRGQLVVSSASITDKANNLLFAGITGNMPWQWPLSDRQNAAGHLQVGSVNWQNNEIGSLTAAVKLKGSAYSLIGTFQHAILKGLTTDISGKAEISGPQFQASIFARSDVTPFDSLHLGRFAPELFNSYIDGKLGFEGEFKLTGNDLQGSFAVMLQNGNFRIPEKKYDVRNINLTMQMPSLPDLRSASSQKFSFDKASIGDFTFEQGKFTWQLESLDSIFIEEGVVRWAGGRIFTNAVRLSPERKEFVVPIFCDRLKLTDLLHEFGITDAEGDGTVSGRIPLLIKKDTIHFEDGFLFSSPGQGGSVRLKAFDMLSTGIPKNTPQFAQVDFAAEALKNFRYNWVKLLFNSEGDDLYMQMQMDGKPVQSLPFSYDTQTGLLQRIQEGTRGIDQPIRLDVNFRLPLNRFLGYSGRIQDIMEQIK